MDPFYSDIQVLENAIFTDIRYRELKRHCIKQDLLGCCETERSSLSPSLGFGKSVVESSNVISSGDFF